MQPYIYLSGKAGEKGSMVDLKFDQIAVGELLVKVGSNY